MIPPDKTADNSGKILPLEPLIEQSHKALKNGSSAPLRQPALRLRLAQLAYGCQRLSKLACAMTTKLLSQGF